MKNFEKTKQDSILKNTKSAAHHGKKKNDEIAKNDLIDCEVPGDSYYTQFADDEQDLQKLFTKE